MSLHNDIKWCSYKNWYDQRGMLFEFPSAVIANQSVFHLKFSSFSLSFLSSFLKMNSGWSGWKWGPKYIQYWRIMLLMRCNSNKCEWFWRCPPNIKVVLKCTSTTVLFWWHQLVKNKQVCYRCPHQLQNPITRSIDITFLKLSIYEPIIVKLTMGIKLYPTSKNPAADIFGQFQVISSVKWLIYFKSGKSYSLIDIIAIKVNLLDFESRTM